MQMLPKSYNRAVILSAAMALVWFGIATRSTSLQVANTIMVRHELPATARPEQAVAEPIVAPDFSLDDASAGSTNAIPVITHVPTTQKVVFLTIDDGLVRDPQTIELLRQYDIQAPMFLNDAYVREDPDFFRNLAQQGMVIGDHTVDHPDLTTLNYERQVKEICDNAGTLEQVLGVRPTLFRPPFGSYNTDTINAAQQCGMRALIQWSAKANGGAMQYQDGHDSLRSGDIVLMHFRPEFRQDFRAFMDAAAEAGLQPANLNDWL